MSVGLDDLKILVSVAREHSFTRAAKQLGVPQSSVSRTIRTLEESLGVRLVSRTTRSVALTEAGERLLLGIGPALETIDAELVSLKAWTGKAAGKLRLTVVRHAFETILRPMLPDFLEMHPDIAVEVSIDDGFVDIVAERFDAGLRFGGFLEKDMIALRVGPDVRTALVASPHYLLPRAQPSTPQELLEHRCINYRSASGGLFPWRFELDGNAFELRVDGPMTLNDGGAILSACLDGLGIGYVFLDQVRQHLLEGSLVSLLPEWCPSFPGYHIYHPSRRHMPPALRALIQALKVHRSEEARKEL